MIIGKRHDTDRRPASYASLRSENLGKQIGKSAGNQIGSGEPGGTDDEIERAYQRGHSVEVANRLFDAGQTIDAGLARRLIGLFHRDLRTHATGMKRLSAGQVWNMAGKNEQVSHSVKRLHLPILLTVILLRRAQIGLPFAEIGQLESHGLEFLFYLHITLRFL